MGSRLSFPFLCLINKAIFDETTDPTSDGVEKRRQCIINGDDIAFSATRAMYNTWRSNAQAVGMVVNEEKTGFSLRTIDLNSEVCFVPTRVPSFIVRKLSFGFLRPDIDMPWGPACETLSKLRWSHQISLVTGSLRDRLRKTSVAPGELHSRLRRFLLKKRWFRSYLSDEVRDPVQPLFSFRVKKGRKGSKCPQRCVLGNQNFIVSDTHHPTSPNDRTPGDVATNHRVCMIKEYTEDPRDSVQVVGPCLLVDVDPTLTKRVAMMEIEQEALIVSIYHGQRITPVPPPRVHTRVRGVGVKDSLRSRRWGVISRARRYWSKPVLDAAERLFPELLYWPKTSRSCDPDATLVQTFGPTTTLPIRQFPPPVPQPSSLDAWNSRHLFPPTSES
jgi:hypothetical protein